MSAGVQEVAPGPLRAGGGDHLRPFPRQPAGAGDVQAEGLLGVNARTGAAGFALVAAVLSLPGPARAQITGVFPTFPVVAGSAEMVAPAPRAAGRYVSGDMVRQPIRPASAVRLAADLVLPQARVPVGRVFIEARLEDETLYCGAVGPRTAALMGRRNLGVCLSDRDRDGAFESARIAQPGARLIRSAYDAFQYGAPIQVPPARYALLSVAEAPKTELRWGYMTRRGADVLQLSCAYEIPKELLANPAEQYKQFASVQFPEGLKLQPGGFILRMSGPVADAVIGPFAFRFSRGPDGTPSYTVTPRASRTLVGVRLAGLTTGGVVQQTPFMEAVQAAQ